MNSKGSFARNIPQTGMEEIEDFVAEFGNSIDLEMFAKWNKITHLQCVKDRLAQLKFDELMSEMDLPHTEVSSEEIQEAVENLQKITSEEKEDLYSDIKIEELVSLFTSYQADITPEKLYETWIPPEQQQQQQQQQQTEIDELTRICLQDGDFWHAVGGKTNESSTSTEPEEKDGLYSDLEIEGLVSLLTAYEDGLPPAKEEEEEEDVDTLLVEKLYELWSPPEQQQQQQTEICLQDGDFEKSGKGLPCKFCHVTFRKMPDLRRHRTTCHRRPQEGDMPTEKTNAPSTSTEPPRKKQRTVNQVGGIGPVAVEEDDDDDDEPKPYDFKKIVERTIKKMGAIDTTYQVNFNEPWQGKGIRELHDNLHDMFDEVLQEVKRDVRQNDVGRVIIHHNDLNSPIIVPLQPLEQLDAEAILKVLEKVLNSNETLTLDQSFYVTIGTIQMPRGAGRKRITQQKGEGNSIHLKRSLFEIVNERDVLCLPRAIAMSWAKIHLITNTEWKALVKNPTRLNTVAKILQYKKVPESFYKNLRDKSRDEQKNLAVKMCELAGIRTDQSCSLNDIPAFEALLQCRILVVSSELGNRFIRVGEQDSSQPKIFLYFVEQPQPHFHGIANIAGFFSKAYFCQTCLKPYDHQKDHSCSTTCIVCYSDECPETDQQMSCRHCHMTCRSLECFERHKKQKKDKKKKKKGHVVPSKCESFWKCTVCKKVVEVKKRNPLEHVCGEWKCPGCDDYVLEDHLCYQAPTEISETNTKFVFFDFECRQDERMECTEGYQPMGVCHTCPTDTCGHANRCRHCSNSWCGKYQHLPNYLVAQSACNECKDGAVDETSTCDGCGTRCRKCDSRDPKEGHFIRPPCEDTCGRRQVIFEGDNAHKKFCWWLFDHKGFTAVAHNNKAYDGYFLLEHMIEQSVYPEKIIYSGSKIMYMHLKRGLDNCVVDSLNFLPMRLAALPKAFELTELKKGYFPHYWNTRDHQYYKGPFPAAKYYGIDSMGTKDREEFLKWHEKQTGIFDFRKEMREYCISDVTILKEACLKFQALMMEATGEKQIDTDTKEVSYANGIDPFSKFITIASVCMGIFKAKFLKEHRHVKLSDGKTLSDWMTITEDPQRRIKVENEWITENDLKSRGLIIAEEEEVLSPIAQVPSAGYVHRDRFSRSSIQWLEWIQHINPQTYDIRHALNGGEHHVPETNYRLDGYCSETHTAFEFNGCLWHGCKKCYPHERSSTVQPRTKQSIEELYALTIRKRNVLKKKGYKLVDVWEHEFWEKQQTNPEMKTFVLALDIQDRLDPRDSFFGGRTNASVLHYKTVKDEKIQYVDFTSLYPWVNKYCRYPVGHPSIVTNDFGPLETYFGIAKVKIVPPRGLYHPVLPYRSNGKLKFPLCRACADAEQQMPCRHSDEERAMLGTWCTPEIKKAVEKGYRILTIYEVYHWSETTQYDQETKEDGLFVEYINTFLRLKQEASGWPEWCKTDGDKTRYVNDYEEREGIQLRESAVKKNPGLRSLAKLCLNSFWGKFGQRLNMKQSSFIHQRDAETFFKMMTDPTKEITDFHILTDSILQLEYRHKSSFVPEDKQVNVFLATFTTAWARLKLYSVLERLDRNVLYYDTDSVIYVCKSGSYQPPLGDYLGDLTDELGGDHIVEFVSGGPKNYAYRTSKGKETCKVRGFTLHHTNAQLINLAAIRDMVLSPTRDGSITVTNPSKISREKRKRKIYNRPENKKYQIVYTKRVILDNLDTLPYGY